MADDLRVTTVLAVAALLLGVVASPVGTDQPRLLRPGKVTVNPETGAVIGQTVMLDPATGRILSVRWS